MLNWYFNFGGWNKIYRKLNRNVQIGLIMICISILKHSTNIISLHFYIKNTKFHIDWNFIYIFIILMHVLFFFFNKTFIYPAVNVFHISNMSNFILQLTSNLIQYIYGLDVQCMHTHIGIQHARIHTHTWWWYIVIEIVVAVRCWCEIYCILVFFYYFCFVFSIE